MNAHRRLVVITVCLGAVAVAHAIEEPGYRVVSKTEVLEVREYEPYLVAEVFHQGTRDEADDVGFRLLFGYISGKNAGERKIEMTAPVTSEAKPSKIEMTAPVTSEATGGGYLVQFVLPRRFTLETVPQPTDARVRIREVPSEKVAVVRFSGFWSESNYTRHLEELRRAVAEAGLQTTGEPVFSRYNAPFTLPFMRRNEIWLKLI